MSVANCQSCTLYTRRYFQWSAATTVPAGAGLSLPHQTLQQCKFPPLFIFLTHRGSDGRGGSLAPAHPTDLRVPPGRLLGSRRA